MLKFFHGRRWAGVLTLMTAMILTAGWVRSVEVEDEIAFIVFDRRHDLYSAMGNLVWSAWKRPGDLIEPYSWQCSPTRDLRPSNSKNEVDDELAFFTGLPKIYFTLWQKRMIWECRDSRFDQMFNWSEYVKGTQDEFGQWRIPYWALVSPLTLLSTYLLVRKPRPKKNGMLKVDTALSAESRTESDPSPRVCNEIDNYLRSINVATTN